MSVLNVIMSSSEARVNMDTILPGQPLPAPGMKIQSVKGLNQRVLLRSAKKKKYSIMSYPITIVFSFAFSVARVAK